MMRHKFLLVCTLLLASVNALAQEFFNLTAPEVRIDSVLPVFTHQYRLGTGYADSVYEVRIDYPEFIDMSATDEARCRQLSGQPLPELPLVSSHISTDRKEGWLSVSFVPLVMRNGRYQKLVSFKLTKTAQPAAASRRSTSVTGNRYADHSVLATGNWAKIRVPETGIYQLTDELVRRAGFSSLQKVRVYGYGGALQPERLTDDYLRQTDDLEEVPTYSVGGRKLFHAVGPVTWSSKTTVARQRNFYSDYGYYFLTEGDTEPLSQDSATFVASCYPSDNDYHSLWEEDTYAWYHSGRNLYNATTLSSEQDLSFTLESPQAEGTLAVVMTYDGHCAATVSVNGEEAGIIEVSDATVQQGVSYFSASLYSTTASYTWLFNLSNLKAGTNTITLRQTSGTANMRPDYVSLTFATPKPLPELAAGAKTLPTPELMYRITNQDHHADKAVDMVIIIPTSQQFLEQAQRLKQLHEEKDSMRVIIVPADELFNEFSSGTPDGNAYRRYLKMLYDRAGSNTTDMPKYLLLFGDGAWDNRMHLSHWKGYTPDDFLLCYESENSFSTTYSYVSDDYFALLDDEEIISNHMGRPDVAVGRIPARDESEAKVMVDKIVAYVNNENAGSWQNVICVMGDDGNGSQHMDDADTMAQEVTDADDAYFIKKIYWDAYTRSVSSTGNRYPEVERLVKQVMRDGALIMNYSGHGAAYSFSHEQVLLLNDFKEASSGGRLPLWVTASCDIAPFDTHEENIGEVSVFNKDGGAIAFLGTTRTVFMPRNRKINQAFMHRIMEVNDATGVHNTVGEALRRAKNDIVDDQGDTTANKLHYTLLGDPAMTLAYPTLRLVVDSVNGKALSEGSVELSAGIEARVSGHVEGKPAFNGIVTTTVLDVEELIVCKLNEPDYKKTDEQPFRFKTRPNIIYQGSDSIVNGRFSISFAVSKDISYSEEPGQIIAYAVSKDHAMTAHGQSTGIMLDGIEAAADDGIGPNIYCYLNSESFQNGGTVNATPYFYATITDKDGINAAGSGIGHDLQLIIDGDASKTYNLNSYFQYDFGDYRSGTVGFSIPELKEGPHTLLFRAWDVLNNSSAAELSFNVDPKQQPAIISVVCTKNPADTFTRFLISHNRTGSQMDVSLQIFDPSGRLLWQRSETGIPTDQTYTIDWDLNIANGGRLQTGVYLYRVLVSSNGSSQASLARKLIVVNR